MHTQVCILHVINHALYMCRANLRKKMDPSYLALYKVRPLDQYSAQILNDLRDSFLKTEHAIGDVNSQLDAQLEKKYEEKRQAGRLAGLTCMYMYMCIYSMYHCSYVHVNCICIYIAVKNLILATYVMVKSAHTMQPCLILSMCDILPGCVT